MAQTDVLFVEPDQFERRARSRECLRSAGQRAEQDSDTNADHNAQLGGATVQPRRHEDSCADYTGVVVVASAWLFFYGLSLSSAAFKQGAEVLASLFTALS